MTGTMKANTPTECNDFGYTVSQFVSVCMGVASMPIALLVLGQLSSVLYKKGINTTTYVIAYTLSLLVLAAAYLSFAIVSYQEWAKPLLDCGIIFCASSSEVTKGVGYTPSIGVIFFLLSLVYAAVNFALTASLAYTRREELFSFSSAGASASMLMKENTLGDELLNNASNSVNGAGNPVSTVDPQLQERERTQRQRKKMLSLFTVFVVLLPFLVFAAAALGNNFISYTPQGIKGYQAMPVVHDVTPCPAGSICPEIAGSKVLLTQSWKVSADVILKFYPDVTLFFGLIYAVSVLALLAQQNNKLYKSMHRRFNLPLLGYTSVGSMLVLLIFAVFFVLYTHYWYVEHNWHKGEPMTDSMILARTAGQVGNLLIGLLLLPASRNSVWSHVFGIPWESALRFHIYTAYLYFIAAFTHMFAWWYSFNDKGFFPHDVFAVPTYFPNNGRSADVAPCSDNWTIPLMQLTFFTSIVLVLFLSISPIRRKFFELFYYAHHFVFVLVGAQILHAESAWYFMMAGLSLYVVDRVIRFWNGNKYQSEPVSMRVTGDVTELVFEKSALSFDYQCGQYAFINIPALSGLQWHPFTISSAPSDRYVTFHIKSMGEGTYTHALQQLVHRHINAVNGVYGIVNYSSNTEGAYVVGKANGDDNMMRGSAGAHDAAVGEETFLPRLLVNVDGPYGLPQEFHRYKHVVLVAGGIGVTPVHSILRQLLALHVSGVNANGEVDGGDDIPLKVHLVWSAREAATLDLFESTLSQMNRVDVDVFTRALFVTRHTEAAHRTEGVTDKGLGFQVGRPSIGEEVTRALLNRNVGLSNDCDDTLVFACGPQALVDDASAVAGQYNCAFHAESFEL